MKRHLCLFVSGSYFKEGEGRTACGHTDHWHLVRSTTTVTFVTCKNCLKEIKK